MGMTSLCILQIAFTGQNVQPVSLKFESGLNLVYGASNTGKSFTLKVIDYMLGGTKPLPEFEQREGYEKIWFSFAFSTGETHTLSRSFNGGGFELYDGIVTEISLDNPPKTLGATQNTKITLSLSQFLLEKLDFAGKKLSKNVTGATEAISFRNVVPVALVDESAIQSEVSPVESGDPIFRTKERSLFRLLLTGIDDSSIVAVLDAKTFNTSKSVRIEVIQEMLNIVETKLSDYSDIDNLASQNEKLDSTFERIQSEFDAVQGSIRALLQEKQSLSIHLPKIGQRLVEIKLHLERFATLDNVYVSDIQRLNSLEEAGFLLSLDNAKACSLCGAPAEAQSHAQDINNIKQIRQSAIVEIEKITNQRDDLKRTISDLNEELSELNKNYPILSSRLDEVERNIIRLTPSANETKLSVREIVLERDEVKEGLSLLEQRNTLLAKLEEFNKLKKPSKDDQPTLKTSDSSVHKLSEIVSEVLKAWEFPGKCQVSFDQSTHDLMIDGKLRVNNGKGVRAVTHAAFKVALLIYCKRYDLPHPGFVVLDSPLLTYRDPMKTPNTSRLTEDEEVLAKSSLKIKFFEHLSSLKDLGQFIIFENIDPPINIETLANVQIFSGSATLGRDGLFPTKK
jgi:DNA repair ATPase RecN